MENDFFNSIYYNILCCTLVPLLICALGVFSFIFKNKYIKILMIILSLFFLCEETSYIFKVCGLSSYGTKNEEFCLKNSANFALIPFERGVRYAQLAERYAQSEYPKEAQKYYTLAHKYIKTYNNPEFLMAGYYYLHIFNDDKTAIEIFSEQKRWAGLAEYYILQDDYKTALNYALKYAENNPNMAYAYELLSAINKNLGDNEAYKNYYEKAQQICSSKICKDRLSDLAKDTKAYLKKPRNYYTKYKIDGSKRI